MTKKLTIKIIERIPTVEEYQTLRRTTNWISVSNEQVAIALSHTLFGACAFHENQLVGMGRVVGDKGLYFYVQDVIVLPEFKSRGIGYKIMEVLEKYLEERAEGPVFVGLMAAKDVKRFYEKFGYQERADNAPGMFKYVDAG